MYAHGLPFSTKYAQNLDRIKSRLAKRFSSIIIIEGGLGYGKTTLGVHTADYLTGTLIKLELNDHPQISMGGEEFLRQLEVCHTRGLPVIIYDEAGDFNKRGALSKFNSVLARTFQTFRAFNVIVIICLPDFDLLDNSLLKGKSVRGLIHIISRDAHSANFSGYDLDRMFYLRHKMQKLINPNDAYRQTRPNFRGHFLDLEPARSAALDKLSTKSKLATLTKSSIRLEGLVSIRDIMSKLGLSYPTASKRLKEARIKSVRKVGQKLYYPADTINRLLA